MKITLFSGLGLQIGALSMLALPPNAWPQWAAIAYVMASQSPSGIAKDLTKMSSKSVIKLVVPPNASGALFKWVAILTGSKNALKGVGVPIFMEAVLGWSHTAVGTFFALWVIGYGVVQGAAPRFLNRGGGHTPDGAATQFWVLILTVVMISIAFLLSAGWQPQWVLIIGLGIFGVVFAINSSVHSYLILAYTNSDKVALNVSFYYMANAGGRLIGTIASGLLYQWFGLGGAMWGSVVSLLLAWLISFRLPRDSQVATVPG